VAEHTAQVATPASWLARYKWILLLIVVGLIVFGFYLFRMRVAVLEEEEPIRVRNSSMDLIVGKGTWTPDNPTSPKGWDPSDGVSKGLYDVEVAQGTGITCDNELKSLVVCVNKIEISYSDKFGVTIQPTNPQGKDKTFVTPHAGLAPVTSDPKILRYAADGYIDGLKVHVKGGGKPLSCSFDESSKSTTEIAISPSHSLCK
jgi:hypothetical protein